MRSVEIVSQFAKSALLVCAALLLDGCTTQHTTELTPAQLHEQIRHGGLIRSGEYVTIVCVDREYKDILVKAVTPDSVLYDEEVITTDGTLDENSFEPTRVVNTQTIAIPIADIVTVTHKELTAAGTAAAYTVGGGAVLGISWLMYALPAALIGAMAL